MELLGRELGTHWADFGNVEPNPNRTMPWSGPSADQGSVVTRLSQLDPDLGNFADGLNGNWLIGLVRSRKNSGKAAAVPTK
jgi:hypothetical protein